MRMDFKMKKILTLLLVLIISGCQSAKQPDLNSLNEKDQIFLQTRYDKDISAWLTEMNKYSYDVNRKVNNAYICNDYFDKIYVNGEISMTFYIDKTIDIDKGKYPPNNNYCEINNLALLGVRDDATKEIHKEYDNFLERKKIKQIEKEKRLAAIAAKEAEQERIDNKKIEETRKKRNSPKGIMSQYSLGVAELKACADNYLVSRRDVEIGREKTIKELKSKLGNNFDHKFFEEKLHENYVYTSKLLALSGLTPDVVRSCRFLAASTL